MASEIFDSLPYYDDDLQKFPELKAKVQEELARELKESQTLHPHVPPAVELFTVREQLSFSIFISDSDILYRIIRC
jgi:hypothetical protein